MSTRNGPRCTSSPECSHFEDNKGKGHAGQASDAAWGDAADKGGEAAASGHDAQSAAWGNAAGKGADAAWDNAGGKGGDAAWENAGGHGGHAAWGHDANAGQGGGGKGEAGDSPGKGAKGGKGGKGGSGGKGDAAGRDCPDSQSENNPDPESAEAIEYHCTGEHGQTQCGRFPATSGAVISSNICSMCHLQLATLRAISDVLPTMTAYLEEMKKMRRDNETMTGYLKDLSLMRRDIGRFLSMLIKILSNVFIYFVLSRYILTHRYINASMRQYLNTSMFTHVWLSLQLYHFTAFMLHVRLMDRVQGFADYTVFVFPSWATSTEGGEG